MTHGLDELRGQEILTNPLMGQLTGHKASAANQRKTKRHCQPGVDETKYRGHHRCGEKLRQCDPFQDAADFYRAVVLHRRQILRNDVRRGENNETKKRNKKQQQRHITTDCETQIDPRPRMPKLMYNEGYEQQNPAEQQCIDQSGIEPVEPVALVESGIKQAEADTGIEYSCPIRVLQELAVDGLTSHAEMNTDEHQRRQQCGIPEYPLPRPMVVEPSFDRSRDVERQLEIERIGRDTIYDQLRRQILHD